MKRLFLIVTVFFGITLWSRGDVLITEILASNFEIEADEFGGQSDWLELYNSSVQSVNLKGWILGTARGPEKGWHLPERVLPGGEVLRVWCSGKDQVTPSGEMHADFRLSAKGEVLRLWRPGRAEPEAVFDYRSFPQYADISFGFSHPYEALDLLSAESRARYRVIQDGTLPKDWMGLGFDDSHWRTGWAPLGFDRKRHPSHAADLETDLSMRVEWDHAGVLFRFPFQIDGPVEGLYSTLRIRAKDGFAAYLNGQKVASFNAPDSLNGDSRPLTKISSLSAQDFSDGGNRLVSGNLRSGRNVLAIHVLMSGPRSEDQFVEASLSAVRVGLLDARQPVYFDYHTPARLNGTGCPELAPRPMISVASRVLDQAIDVELNLPPGESGNIHYTMDGSYPSPSDRLYTGPMTIDEGALLRARCFQEGRNPSPVASESYTRRAVDLRSFDSNLPLVVVDTFETEVGADDYVTGQMTLHDRGPDHRARLSSKPDFVGRVGLKLRGSSTLDRPKSAYRIELRNEMGEDLEVPLLGMPSDSDWILYGPYNFDQSLIRNAFVYEMSRQMGAYAARSRFVEVFVNSDDPEVSLIDYQGLYLLMEKIGRSSDRVDIRKPASKRGGGEALSGGYIFKVDRLGEDESGLYAGRQRFVHVSPNEREVTPAQSEWLRGYLDRCLAAMCGPGWKEVDRGYRRLIDVDAWIDQHLIQELTRNPDAYRYSTFLIKPRNGKLLAGPAWDFDRAMRTNTDEEWVGRAASPRGWIWGGAFNWGKLLMDDPAYQRQFRERGRALLRTVWRIENIHRVIDGLAAEIQEAQVRNHRRWGYLDPGEWRDEIERLKEWLADRMRWLEGRFLPPPVIQSKTGASGPPLELVMATDEPGAKLYYTDNGLPPALSNNRVSPFARLYRHPVKVAEEAKIRAAVLVDGHWSDESVFACVRSQPALAITEIMYHPGRNEDLEYVEIQNLSDRPVAIEAMSLSGEIEYEFFDGDVSVLEPGEIVVVVRDIGSFRKVYPIGAIRVAGEFDGSLSNSGGTITIEGELGESLGDFYYTDAWWDSTDGEGHSLELRRPRLDPLSWRDPRSWFPSRQSGGNPGSVDGS